MFTDLESSINSLVRRNCQTRSRLVANVSDNTLLDNQSITAGAKTESRGKLKSKAEVLGESSVGIGNEVDGVVGDFVDLGESAEGSIFVNCGSQYIYEKKEKKYLMTNGSLAARTMKASTPLALRADKFSKKGGTWFSMQLKTQVG